MICINEIKIPKHDYETMTPAEDLPKNSSPLLQTQELLRDELQCVERQLENALRGPIPSINHITHHVVNAGGKRLRPILSLLAARLCGVPLSFTVQIAAAAEMIHTASLLHDDVVDDPPLRRGQPSAPHLFGNSACILVGDALMARTLTLLGTMSDCRPLIALARCVRRMAVGELLQLAQIGRPHDNLLSYLRTIEGKTSALFAWCCTVGDLAPAPYGIPLKKFGRRLGMAFQIADDILDYAGDPELTGKRLGSDLAEGKFTLPLHFACQENPALLPAVVAIAGKSEADPLALAAILQHVAQTSALVRSKAIAEMLLQRAHQALEACPRGPWRDQLHLIADFMVRRKF
jgi:octaprenyl-diphosphate synthase